MIIIQYVYGILYIKPALHDCMTAVLTVKKNYYMQGYKTKEENKQTRNNTCGLIQSQAFLCRHFHSVSI